MEKLYKVFYRNLINNTDNLSEHVNSLYDCSEYKLLVILFLSVGYDKGFGKLPISCN